ncbi:MAG: family 20 glycosylhydrolase [Bacteroidaceae bacterium]|nr:family 20 glycosylhydrolase [Bacteroidaceae bacterium]
MKKRALSLLLAASLLAACTHKPATADYQVIPLPQEILPQSDNTSPSPCFILDAHTPIVCQGDETMQRNAHLLAEYVEEKTEFKPTVTSDPTPKAVTLLLDDKVGHPEGYTLTVSPEGVTITGATPAGVFYGIQTLRKSLPIAQGKPIQLPAVTINDAPRFSYRGAHLDVSRHYFTVDSIKQFIDMLALHNMNRFHWHLTDDQGWRFETKKYPKLNTIGTQRAQTVIGRNSGEYDGKPYGPYLYTQDECREIVAYAAERHITIIPEIDLPGHMQAALAAYPELGCTGGPYEVWQMWGVSDDVLCAGNDATLQFITDILGEVIEVFPSEYIHVGGDECPKTRWEMCPKCQARIKALGIKGDQKNSAEMYLQSFVIGYAEKFLNTHGRRIIGWDEILEGELAPTATVHSWRGVGGGLEAAKRGHDCIMSPNTYMYFDYYQTKHTDTEPLAIGGYVPIETVYNYEPLHPSLTAEEQRHIIGVQANLWTEYVTSYRHVEYMELPRMAALCEVQWCSPEKKDYADFLQRLLSMVDLYDVKGYNYAKHIFDVDGTFSIDTTKNAVVATMETIDDSPIYYTMDGTEPTTKSPRYKAPVAITKSCTFKAKAIGKRGETRTFEENVAFSKSTAKPITLLQPAHRSYSYAGAITLNDGLKGNRNYRTGRWIGFAGNDFEAIIDLQQPTEISRVSLTTCVEKGDWTFDARGLIISVSDDGRQYTEVYNEALPPMTEENPNGLYDHTLTFTPISTRYVKVKALVERSIPEWHGARGYAGFLFVDEVAID